MGMNMSYMGMGMGAKGVSATRLLSLIMDTLYEQFVEKDIQDFDSFLPAILETFSTINMALPGKHYDPPSRRNVAELFDQWKKASPGNRKQIFTDFLIKQVHINKVDESMIITAIVAPPTAMLAKRTGQTLPQLKLMKAVPDVVFVPSATVVALIAVKILRLMFMKKRTTEGDSNDIPPAPRDQPQPPEHEEEPSRGELAKPAVSDEDKTPTGHAYHGYCPICGVVH